MLLLCSLVVILNSEPIFRKNTSFCQSFLDISRHHCDWFLGDTFNDASSRLDSYALYCELIGILRATIDRSCIDGTGIRTKECLLSLLCYLVNKGEEWPWNTRMKAFLIDGFFLGYLVTFMHLAHRARSVTIEGRKVTVARKSADRVAFLPFRLAE